jgi:hypothetical protein
MSTSVVSPRCVLVKQHRRIETMWGALQLPARRHPRGIKGLQPQLHFSERNRFMQGRSQARETVLRASSVRIRSAAAERAVWSVQIPAAHTPQHRNEAGAPPWVRHTPSSSRFPRCSPARWRLLNFGGADSPMPNRGRRNACPSP